MALLNLTGNIPMWEGQGLCERYYGSITSWSGRRDCSKVIAEMERGSEPVAFTLRQERGSHSLPFDIKHGMVSRKRF